MTGRSPGVDERQQVAHLGGIEFAEVLEDLPRPVGRTDDDLASIVGIGVTGRQPELDQSIDEPRGRRRGDAEGRGKRGHAQLAGGDEDVQRLDLRHRDVDPAQLRSVVAHLALHHGLERLDDTLDDTAASAVGCFGDFGMFGYSVLSGRTEP